MSTKKRKTRSSSKDVPDNCAYDADVPIPMPKRIREFHSKHRVLQGDWEFDPNGSTGTQFNKFNLYYVSPGLEYGPFMNCGFPLEAFASIPEAMARTPNVELKIEGQGRDRLGVMYTKEHGLKSGEWLSLY